MVPSFGRETGRRPSWADGGPARWPENPPGPRSYPMRLSRGPFRLASLGETSAPHGRSIILAVRRPWVPALFGAVRTGSRPGSLFRQPRGPTREAPAPSQIWCALPPVLLPRPYLAWTSTFPPPRVSGSSAIRVARRRCCRCCGRRWRSRRPPAGCSDQPSRESSTRCLWFIFVWYGGVSVKPISGVAGVRTI